MGAGSRHPARLALFACVIALTDHSGAVAQSTDAGSTGIVRSPDGLRDESADAAPRIVIRRMPAAIEIRGGLADEALRIELMSAVRAVFPDLSVTTVAEAAAAPADRALLRDAVTAIRLMRFLAVGEAAIHTDEIRMRGAAFHAAARTALAEAAAAAGVPVSAEDVGVGHAGASRPAAACEAEVAALVRQRPIEFEPGRATLSGKARDVVDQVVYALSACPDAPVAVAGHTDSDGTDEANHRLSLARAQTVIDMMVANGLPAERFTALGYGESRPLASNATERGKAINRRIEFMLRD